MASSSATIENSDYEVAVAEIQKLLKDKLNQQGVSVVVHLYKQEVMEIGGNNYYGVPFLEEELKIISSPDLENTEEYAQALVDKELGSILEPTKKWIDEYWERVGNDVTKIVRFVAGKYSSVTPSGKMEEVLTLRSNRVNNMYAELVEREKHAFFYFSDRKFEECYEGLVKKKIELDEMAKEGNIVHGFGELHGLHFLKEKDPKSVEIAFDMRARVNAYWSTTLLPRISANLMIDINYHVVDFIAKDAKKLIKLKTDDKKDAL